MHFDETDIKHIMQSFLDSIYSVSDLEYQQRVWVEGKGPECDSYDEFCNHFFVEGIDIIHNYKDFGITETQYTMLTALQTELEKFNEFRRNSESITDYLPKGFIKTPEWKKIVALAQEILKAFHYQKKNHTSL